MSITPFKLVVPRLGWFNTRLYKLVHIRQQFQFSEPAQPGMPLQTRTCWRGDLYMANGRDIDTEGVWESDGTFQNPNHVQGGKDLVSFVREDAGPLPAIETSDRVAALEAENATLKAEIAELRRMATPVPANGTLAAQPGTPEAKKA